MKENSELEYYFHRQWKCKHCDVVFDHFNNIEMRKHIKKYHDDEMDFEDHIIALKEGKCDCSGVDITL